MDFPRQFICASKAFASYHRFVPAPYFRKVFLAAAADCRLRVTGLGFYRVWINGTEITKGLLAPYISNPDDLVSIYDYNVSDVKFFKLFDMVKKCYMTGDNWDEKTSTYKDTNTFTIVYKLDERAKDYVWTYIYAVALQTSPEWTYLYTSKTIIDENPEEITITYTQEENFKDGPYVFFIYDQSTKQLTGLQFFVKNTPSETDPSASESTSETT